MYATFNRKKIIFYAVSVFAAVCLVAVVISLCSSHSRVTEADLNSVCVSFLKEKKIRIADDKPQRIETAFLTREFTQVVSDYNELQKKQGFDLSPYAGKTVTKFTYPVKDKTRNDVVAVVFVYGGKVIGGDIHCIGADGYMTGFDGETSE